MKCRLNVVELFAGVGGFRLGLEKADAAVYRTVWANQYEPSRKAQHAYDCYKRNFKEGICSNDDITTIPDKVFQELNIDLLVGGFPCQDYSVARTLSGEKGLEGKKGVLFWEIKRVIENTHPKYILLENVDRLLKSPSKQRGRDFAIMLATLRDLGYIVEWRVVNAAEYGFAQKRRRIFIFAYKESLMFAVKQLNGKNYADLSREELLPMMQEVIFTKGFFANTFPVKQRPYKNRISNCTLDEDISKISEEFSHDFKTAGVMIKNEIFTAQTEAEQIPLTPIKSILLNETDVLDKFYLTESQIERFAYLRGAKKIERVTADGHKYIFSEGGLSATDLLDRPSRTMLTSEGTVNRSTHIVEVNGRKRFLTPIECERLNGFPDNWTADMPDRMRYFCMGNALVVDLITKMGQTIIDIAANECT